MRVGVLACAVIGLFSLGIAQVPGSKPLTPFEQDLIAVQKQFLQANIDKNRAAVNQLVTEDFKGIAVNGDLYDREEALSAAQEGLPRDTRAYEFQVVRLDDGCAVVAYNLIVPNGDPRYRHMSNTWTKIGGVWKLKFQQITPNLWSAKDFD